MRAGRMETRGIQRTTADVAVQDRMDGTKGCAGRKMDAA